MLRESPVYRLVKLSVVLSGENRGGGGLYDSIRRKEENVAGGGQ